MVDLIRDGVPRNDLRTEGDRALWTAFVRTAASASQRGWTFPQWAGYVSETRSNLGRQARLKNGRKERTPADYERTLRNAWDTGSRWAASAPAAHTPADVAARIAALRAFVADADANLTDAERAVLADAADQAEAHRTDRPAMPRRDVGQRTGLGERRARTTLDRLDRRGLLPLSIRGRAAEKAQSRRAGLYKLPDLTAGVPTYLYRGTRSMGHPGLSGARSMGHPDDPAADTAGTPRQVYGTPGPPPSTPTHPTEQEPAVVTVTISAPDAASLAAALDALRREPVAVAAEVSPPMLTVLSGGERDTGEGRPQRSRKAAR